MGEHLPYKQEVTGSSPVVPTSKKNCLSSAFCNDIRSAHSPKLASLVSGSPWGAGTDDIPYRYDIRYADDIRLRRMKERILYHICGTQIYHAARKRGISYGEAVYH